MAYTQVDSSDSHEGELKGTLFAGDHSPDGVFASLKGVALTPPELSFDVQDHNDGPDRLNQEAVATGAGWLAHGPIMSGQFEPDALTRGTDKHMPK